MRSKDRRNRISNMAEDRRAQRDRREHERVLVNFEVDCKGGDNFLFAYITDLSAMGIFIRTERPLPPGTTLNLRFQPQDGMQIDVEGRVIWVNRPRPANEEGNNAGMGVQFMDLTAAQREQLLSLVKTFAYLSDEDDLFLGNS